MRRQWRGRQSIAMGTCLIRMLGLVKRSRIQKAKLGIVILSIGVTSYIVVSIYLLGALLCCSYFPGSPGVRNSHYTKPWLCYRNFTAYVSLHVPPIMNPPPPRNQLLLYRHRICIVPPSARNLLRPSRFRQARPPRYQAARYRYAATSMTS